MKNISLKVPIFVSIMVLKNYRESRFVTTAFISHKIRLKQSDSAFAWTPVWNRSQARKTSLRETCDDINWEHPCNDVTCVEMSTSDVIGGAFLRFLLNWSDDDRFIIFALRWDNQINLDQLVKLELTKFFILKITWCFHLIELEYRASL